MAATEERLSSLDSTFLELEQADEGAMMHIGGALVFDHRDDGGTPTLEELLGMLEDRSQLMPRHRSRLSEARVHGLRRPAWVLDGRSGPAA